ncbi:hypothetical protein [Streptomyces viridochromogenes]|uniref:hypothetical protein n=1 Tax=Streptomyces viridochromogenes TaxID=1938 RepID=UPI001319D08F|nr:hypothetical protein [Streptomyces viridochromogenes]
MGAAALLALWAQVANGWPIWAIPAIRGPLALLLPAAMVAFVIAALRGDLVDDAPSIPQVPPAADAGRRPVRRRSQCAANCTRVGCSTSGRIATPSTVSASP